MNNDYICDNANPNETEGIQELTNSYSFTVFPNPSNGQLSIDFSSANGETVRLHVFDELGKLVYFQAMPANVRILNLDLIGKVSSGLYNFVFLGNSIATTRKVAFFNQ